MSISTLIKEHEKKKGLFLKKEAFLYLPDKLTQVSPRPLSACRALLWPPNLCASKERRRNPCRILIRQRSHKDSGGLSVNHDRLDALG